MFCGLCQTSLFPEWMASMETEEQQSFLLSPVPLGPLSSRSLDHLYQWEKNVQPAPPVMSGKVQSQFINSCCILAFLYGLGLYVSWKKVIYLDSR